MLRKLLFASLSLTFGVAASAQSASIFFKPPTLSSTSGIADAAAVADLNGDGRLDVIYPDGTVLLAKSDGTYQASNPWCSSGQPYCSQLVVAADFNHDGKPDLLIATANFLWVLLGNGDGTFQAAVSSITGVALFSPVVADVNGDGKADVILVPGGNSAIAIFLGKGDGTFQPSIAGPGVTGLRFVIAVDLNGDGKVDILTSSFSFITPFQLQMFVGHGDGTFANVPIVTSTTVSQSENQTMDFSVADLNGDGKLDLVMTQFLPQCCGFITTSGTTFALLGNGDGTFGDATQIASRGGLIATADVNGDGRTDLLLADGSFLDVFLGNGDGTVLLRDAYLTSFSPSGRPIIADFNQDGSQDVLASGVLLFGNGDGTLKGNSASFSNTFASFSNTFGPPAVFADFNQDGKLDVAGSASANGTSAIDILLGDGSGRFAPAFTTVAVPASSVADIKAIDLNGDGKIDLLVTASSNNPDGWAVYFLAGNGDGTFATPIAAARSSQFALSSIALADLNNDRKPDLIVGDSSGAINVFLGNGDGDFTASNTFFGGAPNGEALVAGDFNGDGKQDLVVGVGSSLNFLPGKGDGTFGPAVPATSLFPAVTLVADFNGDGILDVYGPNALALGNGDGTFQAGPSLASGQALVVYTSAIDINGDGQVDLIGISAGSPETVQYALGNGDGTFAAPVILQSAFTRFFFGNPLVGDLNGDGRPDIAFLFSGAIVTMLNILPPPAADFSETVTSPASATVSKGQSASFAFNVAPMAGFQHTVTFTCSGAPANSTCTVSPNSTTVGGNGSTSITVTIATTAASWGPPIFLRTPPINPGRPLTPFLTAISLAILLLVATTLTSKLTRTPFHRRTVLCGFVLIATTLVLVSCGGGSSPASSPPSGSPPSSSGTAAGTYSIKVTGTAGSGASAISHAVTFTLVVQ